MKEAVLRAEERIRHYVRETPLEYSPLLSTMAGCSVFLKLENLQVTGSFKVRGAVNKLLSLKEKKEGEDIVTASTGNHALAVAYGMRKLGMDGTIFLQKNSPRQKIRLLKQYDVKLEFFGTECSETEAFAKEESRKRGAVYISPYNDPDVIAGQGTIAAELLRQAPSVDAVFVAVGGGGLISGIGGFLKEGDQKSTVIGCLPKNSPVMAESIKAGRIVTHPILPTLSDSTAGGIEPGSITFDLCRRLVDYWVLVEENEIQRAMKFIFSQHRLVLEGAAGVSVASFFRKRKLLSENKGGAVIILLCGGNVDMKKFKGLFL